MQKINIMEKLNPVIANQIEDELLGTVGRRYRNETFWIIFLGLITVGGTVAWIMQLRKGLGVTAMNDYVSWGLYISLLFFFVGVSLIGALVSCVLRMSGAKWRYPLIRIAEAITLSAIFFAGFMPVLDMGRPERLLFLITHGRIQSPILWDVVAIALYFIGSVIYFYLPLIPDLAIMRDKITNAPKARKKLWRWMAVGWENNLLQRRLLRKAMIILCIVILPLAISVHTVSAWLIAMAQRPGWNSTIMGPYFVFGALTAGIAIMILVIAKLRHGFRLERYLTPVHFNHLAKILLALTIFYLYLNINKYGVPAYSMHGDEKILLNDLFFGKFAIMFWFTQIIGLIIPIVMLSFNKIRNNIQGTVIAATMVLLGALTNRFLIVIPNMLHPYVYVKYSHPVYNPTLIEWTITASSLAGFMLLIILLFKIFPVITIWEVKEEMEKQPQPIIPEIINKSQIIPQHA